MIMVLAVPQNETNISLVSLSAVTVYHVFFFLYSNILKGQGPSPFHFIPDRDFHMIPGQKGDQRWENFNAHMKYVKRKKVLMFFYFWLNFKSIFISEWMHYFLRAQGNLWEDTHRTLNWFSRLCGRQWLRIKHGPAQEKTPGRNQKHLRLHLCAGSKAGDGHRQLSWDSLILPSALMRHDFILRWNQSRKLVQLGHPNIKC